MALLTSMPSSGLPYLLTHRFTFNYYCTHSRLCSLMLILVVSIITIIFNPTLIFHFIMQHADVCNPAGFNLSVSQPTRYDPDFSNQIIDGSQWQYKNGVDGSWHRWHISASIQTNASDWKVKWFNRAPVNYLGVIVYLSQRSELSDLNMSLLSLRQYLFKPRPVVIFHEGDLDDNNIQLALANTLAPDMPLGFEHIRFPTRVNISHEHDKYALGYHHMCRFFSIMLLYHPLLVNMFTFYWRLDSHSHLFAPRLTYDLFDYMQMNRLQYAFGMVNMDDSEFVEGLWELFHKFLARSCLTSSSAVKNTQTIFFTGGYSLAIFFNNFELSNASLWRNEPRIAAWLRAVDEAGGIYSHRWGDAPIRTLALTQFLERNQMVKRRDVGYSHRHEYLCSEGFHPCVVPSHLKASVKRYIHKGCHRASNPLCQYYPEKRGT